MRACVAATLRALASAKEKPSPRTLYTVGHSTHTAAELIAILRAFGVTRLVDIRSIPRSRTNPQFDLESLPATLGLAEISYTHLAALGGRRPKSQVVPEDVNAGWQKRPFHNYADYAQSAPYAAGLGSLLELAQGETSAMMCSEAVWWRCHRRIVTDYVLARGVPVVHLFTPTKGEPAALTPFAVVAPRTKKISYPVPKANPSPRSRPKAART